MRERIIEIIRIVKPNYDEDMRELVSGSKIDSIEMMEIISRLEDEFDIEINMEYMDANHFDDIDKISEMVEELM